VYPYFVPRDVAGAIWIGLVTALGVVCLWQVLTISIRLANQRQVFRRYRHLNRWVLLAALLLLAIPFGLTRTQVAFGIGSDPGLLRQLALRIDDLLPYSLLIGMLTYLRKLNPTDSFSLPGDARRVGVLIFAFYLAGRTAASTLNLVVIVPLVVGWLVFDRFVLVLYSATGPGPLANPHACVERVLNYQRATKLARSVRVALGKKYSSGDMSISEYNRKVVAGQRELVKRQNDLVDSPSTIKQRLFATGPGSGPWDNAMHAVRWGGLLAIPLVILQLLPIFPFAFGPYPILGLLGALLLPISTWLLIAFLFGYFFHMIRGRDGFTKGAAYAIALVIPTIPFRLVQAQPLFGPVELYQMFEVTAFVLVLGLVAFDLRTLQRLGFSWRELVEVHGLETVTGYVSSIAVSALLSLSSKDVLGQAGEVLKKVASGITG
jgi:hypothetical protein